MEWTEETISHLRSLWDQGLSTAEIGRRMSITKNAVVGKAHRLVLPARPSPIRKGADGEQAPIRSVRATRRVCADTAGDLVTEGAAKVSAAEEKSSRVTPFRKQASAPAFSVGAGSANAVVCEGEAGRAEASRDSQIQATVTPIRPPPPASPPPARTLDLSSTANSRPISSVEPRRRGLTCCWPLGEPGTKQFRFCGGEPLQGKPYCSEHSQLAYVKLRDRRDTVA